MKSSLVKRALLALGRTLALVLTLILCLPVILLPLATAVPAPLWLLLAAAALVLLVVQFRLKPILKGVAVSLAGILLVGGLAVIASQAFARTPPITDIQGRSLPGQHRHTGAGHAQRQPAVDLDPRARCQQTSAAVPGRWAGRQPTGDGALRPGRPGSAFRRRQLGATGLGQVLRRHRSHHHHAGAIHRGRPRPGSATAPAFWPGQGVRAGRILGQRAGHHARPALPGAVPRLHRHRADDRLSGE